MDTVDSDALLDSAWGVVEQRLRRRLKDANSVEVHTTCSHPYCYNKSSACRHLLLRRIWGLHRAGKLDTAAVSSTAVSVYRCCVFHQVQMRCRWERLEVMKGGGVGNQNTEGIMKMILLYKDII